MHCYCLETNKAFIKAKFGEDWSDVGGEATDKYCTKWMANKYQQQAMVILPSIVIVTINTVLCMIFEAIASFEKSHSTNDETQSTFIKILIL